MTNNRHVVLSGCSGGGKSTILAELAYRGFATIPEPGRRIVEEELRHDGAALPWINLAEFAKLAISVAAEDRRQAASSSAWVFFDRGLVDAATALEHATGEPVREILMQYDSYHSRVFLTPPWPKFYTNDSERRHDLESAIAEYERLLCNYENLGYEISILPKVSVGERADYILDVLAGSKSALAAE